MAMWPSGFKYREFYLYSNKSWEMASTGSDYHLLTHGLYQNAPIVITSSGSETTYPNDAWAQVAGSGKYEQVGYGHFTLLPDGGYDTRFKQFAIHPDSSGKLVFNQVLGENVFIEYESGPSGYYLLDTLDVNPIAGEAESGFLTFSEITAPTTLYLMTSQATLKADSNQRAKLTAKLFDVDFDPVPSKQIVFELQSVNPYSTKGHLEAYNGTVTATDGSGVAIEITEVTNQVGEAYASYWASIRDTGIQNIKAYYSEASGVYDIVQIGQFYYSESPFILDISLLDTLDYLV